MDLRILEDSLGIIFEKKEFLKEALTHRSYLNENPGWGVPHNERLEFLGDAVLELVSTEYLFKKFPSYPEGQLTSIRASLVNYQTVAKSARDIDLEKSILMSRGEAKDIGRAREVILVNAMEALIGAIYLDKGYESAREAVEKFLIEPNLDPIMKNSLYRDPKSELQEVAQERVKITPIYKILEEWGPDHKKIFRTGVYFGEKLIAEGEGYSKQEAEFEAAKNAIKGLA